jgi:selenocysteine lyase/cysteine desulfurase
VWLVVDGIQGVGVLPLDLARTHVDLLACGGQKWLLSPWGSGFTYVHPDMLEVLAPQPVSWMAVRGSDDFASLVDYDLTWRDGARRFEQITVPFQDFAGMAASLELLRELGHADVSSHIEARVAELADGARNAGVPVVTPQGRTAGIVTVRPRDVHATSERLRDARVVHSVREGTIRLSPHCYTTSEEIGTALGALVD